MSGTSGKDADQPPKCMGCVRAARRSLRIRGCRWLVALLFAPWCAVQSLAQILPAKPAESPREVFRLYDMDDPYFGGFVEDEPFTDEEWLKLWKTLLRVTEFRQVDVERWARHGDEWPFLLQDPIRYRAEMFEIRGQARRVSRMALDDATRARFNFAQIFRVDVLAQDGTDVVVFTPTVPNGWPRDVAIDEPISCFGVLVKRMIEAEGKPRLVFVAPRVAWHPKTMLGKLGMDEGLFDTVRHRRPLSAGERACFYQLLAAAGRMKPYQLEAEAYAQLMRLAENLERNKSAYSGDRKRKAVIERQLARARERRDYVVPLFNEPDANTGKLVVFEGDARRCVEIRVDDPDIVERFGIRRYYEIAMFTDDSQGNPLIFCVLELPEAMPVGEDVFQRVRIAGFFLKSWEYPQGKRPGDTVPPGKVSRQLAPLVLGRDARLIVQTQSMGDYLMGAVVVSGIVAAMLAILWAAFRTGRTPKPVASSGENHSSPDFSSLE